MMAQEFPFVAPRAVVKFETRQDVGGGFFAETDVGSAHKGGSGES